MVCVAGIQAEDTFTEHSQGNITVRLLQSPLGISGNLHREQVGCGATLFRSSAPAAPEPVRRSQRGNHGIGTDRAWLVMDRLPLAAGHFGNDAQVVVGSLGNADIRKLVVGYRFAVVPNRDGLRRDFRTKSP